LNGTMVCSTGCCGLRQLQLFQQLRVAQRHRLRLVDDVAQLLGAQQRHGGHRHQPGLDHRQPGQRHADRVAAAQQHAVAGHQTEVLHQHLRDAVHTLLGLGIGQRDLRRAQHGAVGEALGRALSSSSSTRFRSGICSSGRS
jgi:hypothetical protein